MLKLLSPAASIRRPSGDPRAPGARAWWLVLIFALLISLAALVGMNAGGAQAQAMVTAEPADQDFPGSSADGATTTGIVRVGQTSTDLSDRKVYSYNMPSAPAPDLVVDTPSVSDSAPAAGESFTLSATVRNQGSGSSGSTALRYYQSTDSAISSSDAPVGSDSVSGLSAAGSSPESVSLTTPSTPGTYYYGACVDAVSDKSDTQNNCSASVALAVGAARATRSFSPPSVSLGGVVVVTITTAASVGLARSWKRCHPVSAMCPATWQSPPLQ